VADRNSRVEPPNLVNFSRHRHREASPHRLVGPWGVAELCLACGALHALIEFRSFAKDATHVAIAGRRPTLLDVSDEEHSRSSQNSCRTTLHGGSCSFKKYHKMRSMYSLSRGARRKWTTWKWRTKLQRNCKTWTWTWLYSATTTTVQMIMCSSTVVAAE